MLTTVELLHQIAVDRFKIGAFAAAENLWLQILEQLPSETRAMHGLADVAIEQGQFAKAEELLGQLSVSIPENADVLVSMGRTHMGLQRYQDAVTCLERAAVLDPGSAKVQRVLSEMHLSEGNLDKAIDSATKATRLAPNDAESCRALGNAFLEARQPGEALSCYERLVAIKPDDWQAYANGGMAFILAGRLEDAEKTLTFSNSLNPMEPMVVLPLSSVLIDLGKYADAALLLDGLLAMSPHNPKVLTLCGINAYKRGNCNAAIGNFIKALALDEDNMELRLHLGEALIKEGKTENALTMYRQALGKDPDQLQSYVQIARIAFYQDQFGQAFETIAAMQPHVKANQATSAPLWDGTDLTGKRLLLYSQFGMDEFNLFIRFVNAMEKKGSATLVKCTKPVHSLATSLDGVDKCLLPEDQEVEFDCHSPLEHLPSLLGISDEDIAKVPGFTPDEDEAEVWRSTFQGSGKINVGIMWRKEIDELPAVYRSIPLGALAPLAELDDVQLYSLQTACGKDELDTCGFKEKIRHLAELENTHLAGRLVGVAGLDLLITPDTFTAQIAAQAGLPVWILLSTGPEWYYGFSRNQSVWLPSARLFRQNRLGAWGDVVTKVVEALREQMSVKEESRQ